MKQSYFLCDVLHCFSEEKYWGKVATRHWEWGTSVPIYRLVSPLLKHFRFMPKTEKKITLTLNTLFFHHTKICSFFSNFWWYVSCKQLIILRIHLLFYITYMYKYRTFVTGVLIFSTPNLQPFLNLFLQKETLSPFIFGFHVPYFLKINLILIHILKNKVVIMLLPPTARWSTFFWGRVLLHNISRISSSWINSSK